MSKKTAMARLMEDRALSAFVLVLVVSSFFVGGALLSVYVSGWNVQVSADEMVLDGNRYNIAGLKTKTIEIDADFVTGDPSDGAGIYSKPGITVEHSAAYFASDESGEWAKVSEPHLVDTYDVNFTDEHFVRYNQYSLAYDVTIKTDASKYYKVPPIPFVQWGYIDYGWYWEDGIVDADVFTTFAIAPWTAEGATGNWEVVDGWAGIMSAFVGELEFGLIDADFDVDGETTEDKGHVCQDLNSRGSQLNMFVDDNPESERAFQNPDALVGVPSTVQIEVGATLGAGAAFGLDGLSHVWDLAVKNVYVKYTVIVSMLTTLDYMWALGDQPPMDPPEEDNTVFNPKIGILELLGDYQDLILLIFIAVVVLLGLLIILRFSGVITTAIKYKQKRSGY